MAIIPIANLVLLFKASLNDSSPKRRSKSAQFAAGAFGIAIGVLLVGGGIAIQTILDEKIRENNQRIENDPYLAGRMAEIIGGDLTVEDSLQAMATGFSGRLAVDDVTFLVSVKVEGDTLRRILEVTRDDFFVTEEFRHKSNASICAFPAMIPLLKGGATIEDVYILKSGTAVGTVVTTLQQCP